MFQLDQIFNFVLNNHQTLETVQQLADELLKETDNSGNTRDLSQESSLQSIHSFQPNNDCCVSQDDDEGPCIINQSSNLIPPVDQEEVQKAVKRLSFERIKTIKESDTSHEKSALTGFKNNFAMLPSPSQMSRDFGVSNSKIKQPQLFESYQKDINTIRITKFQQPTQNMTSNSSIPTEDNIFTYSESKFRTTNQTFL